MTDTPTPSRTGTNDKVATLSCGPTWGWNRGGLKDLSPIEYGDWGSNYHPNHLINDRQVFIIQNECSVNPMVQSIRMSIKPEIHDYHKVGIPILWSTRMDHQMDATRYLSMR